MFLHPKRAFRLIKKRLRSFILYYCIPDRIYLKVKFRKDHGYKLNLRHPHTIDEKLQWLKLYDRQPHYHKMIDKIMAKEFVTQKLGTNDYTIPLLGKWNHFDEIDFDSLPKQFVLKCNHDSASWIICRDKNLLDKDMAKKKLEEALKTNYYRYSGKQWGYNHIKPLILAEELLSGDLIEYQVFCNNGIPIFFLVRNDLGESLGKGYNVCYSLEWEKKDYRIDKYPAINLQKPQHFEEMLRFSRILSEDTLHLRVDFYETNGKLYVGELTFYSNGGNFHNFTEEGKQVLTDSLQLPVSK